jgi:hypothetical protein
MELLRQNKASKEDTPLLKLYLKLTKAVKEYPSLDKSVLERKTQDSSDDD